MIRVDGSVEYQGVRTRYQGRGGVEGAIDRGIDRKTRGKIGVCENLRHPLPFASDIHQRLSTRIPSKLCHLQQIE